MKRVSGSSAWFSGMGGSGCLVLMLSCFWVSVNSVLSPTGVNFEVQALVDIKESLVDPHGVFGNWDAAAVDPCSWSMITCSSDSLVIGFESPSQSLSGTFSSSIANLTNLQTVLLQNNNISGPIPTQIGRLSKLLTLDLSNNSFSGELPSPLSNLRMLQYLRLNNNSLTGAIPPSLANLTHLALLDLSYNNLSGPVPNFRTKNINVLGNPPICVKGFEPDCYGIPSTAFTRSKNNSKDFGLSRIMQNHKVIVSVGVSLGCICILSIAVMFALWWRKRQHEQDQQFFDFKDTHDELRLGNLRRFQFRELQAATNNFSSKNILGRGGFGIVYKGILQDNTVLAVKRLRDGNTFGGETQFQTEVEMISLAVHRNLLKLQGFCATVNERILVYPYMSNGSVAKRLKAKPALDWSTRKRIAIGAARGLVYLHEQCDPKIIHRDVKAANILLDDDCEAVVGDFGLAKLLNHCDSHVTTAVRGTVGHIAPEYLSTGQSSEKTDVYGFGILLLELITGQRALEFGKPTNQKGVMLDWVKQIYQEGKLEMLTDNGLKNKYDMLELQEMVQLAMLCTQHLPVHRPRMSDIVRMLQGDGLADKWEASQRADSTRSNKANELSLSDRYSDLTDDSSLVAQEMELSGPR